MPVPDFIYHTARQPAIAVFLDYGESYGLGCARLLDRWNAVPVHAMTEAEYFRWQDRIPVVAGIHCDSRTRTYAPYPQPGTLVFQHNNGETYFHFVDDIGFIRAINRNGNMQGITPEQLRQIAIEGLAFHSFVR